MFIRKIHFENFKSLKDVTIDGVQDLSIFVGKNNTGKSAIFDALSVFRLMDGQTSIHPYAFDKDPKNPIKIDLTFQLREETRRNVFDNLFGESDIDPIQSALRSEFLNILEYQAVLHQISETNCQVMLNRAFTNDFDGELIEVFHLNPNKTTQCEVIDLREACSEVDLEEMKLPPSWVGIAYPKVKGPPTGHIQLDLLREFVLDSEEEKRFFSYAPYRISPPGLDKFGSLLLSPNGGNLPQVLDTFYLRDRDGYDKMEETIRRIVPEVKSLTPYLEGSKTSPTFTEHGLKSSFSLGEVGTGVQQLLILVVAVFVAREGSVICIEEPEIHHHAQTQRNFFNFLRD